LRWVQTPYTHSFTPSFSRIRKNVSVPDFSIKMRSPNEKVRSLKWGNMKSSVWHFGIDNCALCLISNMKLLTYLRSFFYSKYAFKPKKS